MAEVCAGTRIDLTGCGSNRLDRARGRAARGHRRGVRADPGPQEPAGGDLRHRGSLATSSRRSAAATPTTASITFKLRKPDRLDVTHRGRLATASSGRSSAAGSTSGAWSRSMGRPRRRRQGAARGRVQAARPPAGRPDDVHAPEPDPDRRDAAAARARLGRADGHLARRRRARATRSTSATG